MFHEQTNQAPPMIGFINNVFILLIAAFAGNKISAMFSEELYKALVFGGSLMITSYVQNRKKYHDMFRDWYRMMFKRKQK